MASDDWDADTFKPTVFTGGSLAKWEGEDEDDDVKDNWDDLEEEDKEKEDGSKQEAQGQTVKVKKKKQLKDVLAGKEEKPRKAEEIEAPTKKLTAEEAVAEKLRQQRLQEESDLQVAKETFGVGNEVHHGIETMQPSKTEDFEIFRKALVDVITRHDRSSCYIPFLEDFFRELCLNLEADDVKKLGNCIHMLANEKVKAAKATKGKKKGSRQKASLVVGKANDYAGDYEEFEDFI